MTDMYGFYGDDCLTVMLEEQRKIAQWYQEKMELFADLPVEQRQAVPIPNNFIGERIQYLLEQQGIDVASFCRYVGISRSTMHRYLKGSHVPSQKNMDTILKHLDINSQAFAAYPFDFESWKATLISDRETSNFFEMCDSFRWQLDRYDITYTASDGKEKKLPHKHYETFCKLFDDAVELLRLTLND